MTTVPVVSLVLERGSLSAIVGNVIILVPGVSRTVIIPGTLKVFGSQ